MLHGRQTSQTELPAGAPDTPQAGDFTARFTEAYYSDVQAISERVAAGKGSVLLDGRTEGQFLQEEKHPKSRIHGRIPGATLFSCQMPMMRAPTGLSHRVNCPRYTQIMQMSQTSAIANTDHWAATNWFVISEILGNKDARLYDGSMVE